jgi:hypothetical protein
MTATCLGVLLTMLSGSTSGIGRENANQEFEEFKEKVQETGGGGRGRVGVWAYERIGVWGCEWT